MEKGPGHPPIFETPEEMEKAIEAYFDGLERPDPLPAKPPTMTGLARALGYVSRQSLYDAEKREGFSYLIKEARARIKEYWEERLAYQGCTGAIFWLKNHDEYRDVHEVASAKEGFTLHIDQDMTGV